MSIKIDGKANSISKTSGNNVYVHDKLYLNDKEITGENTGGGGGGGTSTRVYYDITKNGDYSYADIPSDVTHVKINISDYEGVSEPFVTGYKQITANTTLQRSSLTGDGLSVRVPDPNQTVEEISDQKYTMSKRDFTVYKQTETKQLNTGIDYSLYDVKVKATISGKMKWQENMESSSQWVDFELTFSDTMPKTRNVSVELEDSANLYVTFNIQYIDDAWYLVCSYELRRLSGDYRKWYCETAAYTATLSFTPKATVTTMSINQTEEPTNTSNTINNLIINNDALILET